MKIQIYKCPKCDEEIYSRANYDFIYCKCKKSALDGGHENNGVWKPHRLIGFAISAKSRIIEIKVTEKQLYEDWNNSYDKYGRIKNG